MNKAKLLSWAFWLILAASSGTLALFAGITLYLGPKLPEVETLRQIKLQTPLRIYSHDGLLIGEFGEKRRNPITIDQVPKEFIDAILAAEDDRFYSHPGVDIKGLLRAASQLLKSGEIQTGGSTITMQVARNFFLTRKQTFSRKFNEILLALQIEKELSKAEILELYTNKIYLGNRAYGIEAAARVYYGKSISELSVAQLAMIAGLPKAPSAYNPIVNPERALVRRNWILGRMLSLGYLDQQGYQTAVNEPVSASYHGSKLELQAPYVAEMARKEAVDRLGLAAYTDGFKIYTSVDSRLQARAQQAVRDGLMTYDKRHGYRGPEATLLESESGSDDIDSSAPADEQTTDSAPPSALPLADWQDALKAFKDIGDLQAAAVTQVNPNSVDFLMADGTQATIKWENGLSKARPYITENRMGAAPKTASDLFKPGDVIRVIRAEDNAPQDSAPEDDASEAETETASEDTDSVATAAQQPLPEDDNLAWHLTQVPAAQAALVSLNPDDGAIRALVGGFDFQQSHFNRATQAERQPGSNFKPFIYTTALEHGMTPATIINDAPIVFDDPSLENTWRPENASGKFFGPTRLRQALYKSRNLVSIRVLRSIGIETALDSMSRYGLDRRKMPRDLSLALGTHVLTPLQVASGYTVFANGGFRVEPYLVERIDNVDGETIYRTRPATVCRECELAERAQQAERLHQAANPDHSAASEDGLAALESAMAAELSASQDLNGDPQEPLTSDNDGSEPTGEDSPTDSEAVEEPLPQAPRVLSEQVAYLIDDMLRDVIRLGTGRRAKVLNRQDLAGKTGTTNGPTDAWFSGYNRHIVTTAWLGFDKNTNLGRREYGGTSALPIWIDYMETALDGVPEEPRSLPDGLVSVRIDPVTGKRAPADQPNAIFELFPEDNLPPYGQSDAPTLNGGNNSDEPLPEELF